MKKMTAAEVQATMKEKAVVGQIKQFCEWNHVPLLEINQTHGVPKGTYTTPGTPDLLTGLFGWVVLWETKRPKGGRLSSEQLEWIRVFATVDVCIETPKTFDEFKASYDWYKSHPREMRP